MRAQATAYRPALDWRGCRSARRDQATTGERGFFATRLPIAGAGRWQSSWQRHRLSGGYPLEQIPLWVATTSGWNLVRMCATSDRRDGLRPQRLGLSCGHEWLFNGCEDRDEVTSSTVV